MMQDKKLRNKIRLSYAVSTVSIAMVLFLLGSVGYLISGLIGASDRLKERLEVSVMLNDITVEERLALGERLKANAAVHELRFVTKDEAASQFIEEGGDDFSDFLDFNPLRDSYIVQLKADATADAFEADVHNWEGVHEVVYQRAVMAQIGPNIGKFQLVLLIFGAVLLVISVILLNNTIRVSVYAKRHIISTMKLVGAESGFIMRPFVRTSIVQGLWAAVIAAALFVLLAQGLGEELPEITLSSTPIMWVVLGMLVVGVLISLIFTTLAVRKFLRMHTDDIHMY